MRKHLISIMALSLSLLMLPTRAYAVQVPDPTSSLFIQTSGPNAGISIGDYYTAPTGGNTDHEFILRVPSNWAPGTTVTVALFDPEVAGPDPVSPTAADEIRGSADSSTFRLISPSGTTLATQTYSGATTNGTWVTLATFDPDVSGTGTYSLRVSVSDDDDNSWRVDASHDPDCTVGGPGSCPSSDLLDGDETDTAGGSSSLGLGVLRTSFQHAGSGSVCQTHVFYVGPSTPRPLRAHNFDMDGGGSVTYHSPSGASIAGTVSGNGQWNGSADATRVGDLLPDENGWWSAEICISSTNQYVFEAPNGQPAYSGPVPTPRLSITKDDGIATSTVGAELDYEITVANVSDTDPTPGTAHQIVVTDPLPTGATFSSCTSSTAVTCDESAGTVTASLDDPLAPGDTVTVTIAVTVDPTAPPTISNTATLTYEDHLGNEFDPEVATDQTDIDFNPALSLTSTGDNTTLRGDTVDVTFTLTHDVGSDGSAVANPSLACSRCDTVTYVSGDVNADSVLESDETWTYAATVSTNGADPDPLSIDAQVDGVDGNGNTASATATHLIDIVEPGTIAGGVYEDLNGNGVLDPGEPGIPAQIVLTPDLGAGMPEETADGSFAFDHLAPGEFAVDSSPSPSGPWSPTTPSGTTVTLVEGASLSSVNFGYARPGTLSGVIWNDVDLDGWRDPTETGLAGMTVTVDGPSLTTPISATTSGGGSYSFELLPGTYTVTWSDGIPAGWTAGTPMSIEVESLSSGGALTGLDFGAGNRAPALTTRSQVIRFGSTADPMDGSDPEGTDVVYTLIGGDLPTGLGLNADGTFRGVAGRDGTFEFTVSLCDMAGIPSCSTFDYTITVQAIEVVQAADVLPFTGIDFEGLLTLAALLMLFGVAILGSLPTYLANEED